MAHQGLGETSAAEEALAKADFAWNAWLDALLAEDRGTWAVHRGATGDWPIDPLEWLEFQLLYAEAQRLLGKSPTQDARLGILRARALAGLRRTKEANEQYSKVLELEPDDPRFRLEALRSRAFYLITRGRFIAAAKEFENARRLAPEDADLWRFRAIAHLWTGNEHGYRTTCQAMVDRFVPTTDSRTAGNLLNVCVCLDDTLTDWQRLTELGPIAAEGYPDSRRFMGALNYRLGNYQASLQCFHDAESICRLRAFDLYFLAMTLHQLGQADEASKRLDQAQVWIDEANRSAIGRLSTVGMQAEWGPWTELPETFTVRRESHALILGERNP
jgi:tetratricopeptide (TPR) repeat protein